MELQPEKTDNPNSPFFSWNSVGDKIEGLYIDYEKKAGQYSKPQLTLKLRDGNKKFVNCGPVELQKRLEGPAERGELDGLWITITFIGEEDSGKENKKKLFKVEAGPKPAVAAQHRTVQATREPGDDSDQEDPFDGPNVRAKAR